MYTPLMSVSLYSIVLKIACLSRAKVRNNIVLGKAFSLFVPFYRLFCLLVSLEKRNFAVVIELERHIEILLLGNDCVIVPNLGGFMAHHVEARYDEGEGIFLPPLRTLGFNPQLRMNDSLLAQSYVEAYDISYPEALRRIEGEVEELRQHLDNEGSYELNDIGTLSLNDEGNIVFEPCEAGILTPALYGLSSYEMAASSRRNGLAVAAELKRETADVAKPMGDATAADGVEEAETAETELGDDSDDTIKIKVAWIRNAVAVAAAVVAFLLISTPISNSYRAGVSVSGVGGGTFGRFVPKEMVKGEMKVAPEQVQETMATPDTAAVAAKPATAESEKDTSDTIDLAKTEGYCIVMASHVTMRNANAYVDELRSDGYSDTYVYKHNGVVRVVYGDYESESEAYGALRKLRGEERFEESWVYKKR